jgi:putative membrane protein
MGPQTPEHDRDQHSSPGSHGHNTSDHLANERTFLAWIRTSISVIGLGFVVAKFSVWLRELAARLGQPTEFHHSSLSLPLGIALMIFGGLLSVTAAWRYRSVKKAIQTNQSAAAEGTTIAIAIIVACAAVALVVYMVISA